MYKLTDSEFKQALRNAVIEHAKSPNGPYHGELPKDATSWEEFRPWNPIWPLMEGPCAIDGSIDRNYTLQRGPYHFLTDEQRKQLLEEIEPFGTQNAISPGEPK